MTRTPSTDATIHAYCRSLYDRTRALWLGLEGKYPTWQCRFSILYGPPVLEPDLLILGSNPGFDPADIYDDEMLTWPTTNEYTTKNWRLAVKLRSLFANAGLSSKLENSLGTNRLFFKSRSLGRHPSGLGWADNDSQIRARLESFCEQEVDNLIRAVQPKCVLTLGLSVFDVFTDSISQLVSNPKGRRIASVGLARETKTIGIIHPTGAQVANEDWLTIAGLLATELVP